MSGASTAPRPTADDIAEMAWWNALTEAERAHWLAEAQSARPVDAWRAYQRQGPLPA